MVEILEEANTNPLGRDFDPERDLALLRSKDIVITE